MHLDGDRANSDMLYFNTADGNYVVFTDEVLTNADITNNGTTDNLRFATVGSDSQAYFEVWTRGHLYDIQYTVESRTYTSDDEENDDYNEGDNKPGQDSLDDVFTDGDTNWVIVASTASDEETPDEETPDEETPDEETPDEETPDEETPDEETPDEETPDEETPDEETPDEETPSTDPAGTPSLGEFGKAALYSARAHYFSGIYLDTLNKRMGEARFVDPNAEDGVWVRLRHDSIGKTGQFRSENIMINVGYDHKLAVSSGDWHVGAALDYMHSSHDFRGIDGDGNSNRFGAWLYATYIGNDGPYADFVFKYDHLKTDYNVIESGTGFTDSGDFCSDVLSLSGEFGWKFANSEGWFVEPQVQLQYSYMSDDNYTTSSGIKVKLDDVNSLIGRAGVRLGRDFEVSGSPVSAYLRADVMHEWLGDQDIRAADESGSLSYTYHNDDTWYDVGIGLSLSPTKNSYLFIEAEKVMGASFKETYTVSMGGRYSF